MYRESYLVLGPAKGDFVESLGHSPIGRSHSGPGYLKEIAHELEEKNLLPMHEHFRSSPVVSGFRPSLSAPHSPEKAYKEKGADAVDRWPTSPQPIPLQNNLSMRPRVKTMSDLPLPKYGDGSEQDNADTRREQTCKGYVNPYFVFLQFFCSPQGGYGSERPILLEHSEVGILASYFL